MSRRILLAYQLITGLSDTATGALLMVAPDFTLRLMHLRAPADALVYVSFVGAFVLSVGLACLCGAVLAFRGGCQRKLEIVWVLTALPRASVAIFVAAQILVGALQAGWLAVALFDGACVLVQAIGLRKGWLARATN